MLDTPAVRACSTASLLLPMFKHTRHTQVKISIKSVQNADHHHFSLTAGAPPLAELCDLRSAGRGPRAPRLRQRSRLIR